MVNAKVAPLSAVTAVLDASINSLGESLDHDRLLRARNCGSNNATPVQQASTSHSKDLRSSVRQRIVLGPQRTFHLWASYPALGQSSRDECHLGCGRRSLQSCFRKKGEFFKQHRDFNKRSGEKGSTGLRPLKPHTRLFRHGGRCTCAVGPAQFGAGKRPYTVVMIVPTGVGATIGGYAGDALPVARTLASIADCLITHPNVLNGAMMYWPIVNALYVEGYGLDKFAAGKWGLRPVHQNRIGIVFDAGIEDDLRLRHLQVADGAQATLGLSLGDYIVTDMPLQVEKWIDPRTGASTGRLGRPDSLMRAVRKLLEGDDIDAVAVVGRFPDDSVLDLEEYRQGQGVDALAGVEAVISHMVVKEFRVPCAHAPALQPIPLEPVSPRSAAEEIGYTFLPCVLAGLSKAPQFVEAMGAAREDEDEDEDGCRLRAGEEANRMLREPVRKGTEGSLRNYGRLSGHFQPAANHYQPGVVWSEDVDAVVVPGNACGGQGTLAFSRRKGSKPLLIAVEENQTVMDDTPSKLQIDAVIVKNYWEAAGVIAAHKAGVNPMSLRKDGVSSITNRERDRMLAGVYPSADSQYLDGNRVMVNSY